MKMEEGPPGLFWCRILSWGCEPSENENIYVSIYIFTFPLERVYSFHGHFRLCHQIVENHGTRSVIVKFRSKRDNIKKSGLVVYPLCAFHCVGQFRHTRLASLDFYPQGIYNLVPETGS